MTLLEDFEGDFSTLAPDFFSPWPGELRIRNPRMGRRIRNLMFQLHLTVPMMVRLTGETRQTILLALRGKTSPATLARVAFALGVTVDRLTHGAV